MSYGMNENQNVFVDGKRTTSRVTNEPGGKSSIQLGWDPQDECKSGKGKKSLSGVKSSVHLGWDPSQDDCKTAKGKKSIPGAKSSVHLGWDPSQDAIKTGKKERARTLLRSLRLTNISFPIINYQRKHRKKRSRRRRGTSNS